MGISRAMNEAFTRSRAAFGGERVVQQRNCRPQSCVTVVSGAPRVNTSEMKDEKQCENRCLPWSSYSMNGSRKQRNQDLKAYIIFRLLAMDLAVHERHLRI